MAQEKGRFQRVLTQGRVPLWLSLSLLLLVWGLGTSILLFQHSMRDSGKPVRRIVSREGYSLLLVCPERFNPSLRDQIVTCFFAAYPKEVARFNPSAPRSITLVLEPSEGSLETGLTVGKALHLSNLYFSHNPQQIDVVTFSLFGVVQNYPEGKYPAWICDGLADYARNAYGINNAAAGWSLGAYDSKQRYTDSYRVTARFFTWMEKHVDGRILEDLDGSLRAGSYTDDFWKRRTGRTVDQLWTAYGADPAL